MGLFDDYDDLGDVPKAPPKKVEPAPSAGLVNNEAQEFLDEKLQAAADKADQMARATVAKTTASVKAARTHIYRVSPRRVAVAITGAAALAVLGLTAWYFTFDRTPPAPPVPVVKPVPKAVPAPVMAPAPPPATVPATATAPTIPPVEFPPVAEVPQSAKLPPPAPEPAPAPAPEPARPVTHRRRVEPKASEIPVQVVKRPEPKPVEEDHSLEDAQIEAIKAWGKRQQELGNARP